jgi:hypothetical protein
MSAPRKHPVHESIRIATEATALMWRCYDNHIATARYDHGWKLKATEIFARCTACEERLLRLKQLRTRVLGPIANGAEPSSEIEHRMPVAEAEWEVRKLQHLLAYHESMPSHNEDWKTLQIRLISGLRNAVVRLVDATEKERGLNGDGKGTAEPPT